MSKFKLLTLVAMLILLVGCTVPADDASDDSSEQSASAIPTSGEWSFSMPGGAQNLTGTNCPTASSGVSSAGMATLIASADGLTATMNLDSQTVDYTRASLETITYESSEYEFPVKDAEDNTIMGTVVFDLFAFDPTNVVGTLHWDNLQGCTGTYSYEMELVSAY